MIFALEAFPIQFCLVVILYPLSIISIFIWIRAARNSRREHLGRKVYPRGLAGAILALVLPTLAISGSLSLFIGVQHLPCRSDYSTNTDAPLASSVLLITNFYGGQTEELTAIHARDGATQWVQQIDAVSGEQKAKSINLIKTTNVNSPPHLSYYIFQNSVYSLGINPISTADSIHQNLHITSTDIVTEAIQWERDFRIDLFSDIPLIQLSRFDTHLYLHDQSTLFALDATNGATRWQRQIGESDGANAIEAGNVVYAPGMGDNGRAALYALNTQDGGQIWQCNNFGFGAQFSALALYHGVLLANSRKVFPHYSDFMPQFSEPANAMFALSAEDGSVYWRIAPVDEY